MSDLQNSAALLIVGILCLYFFKEFRKIGAFEWEKKYNPYNTSVRIYSYLLIGVVSLIVSLLFFLKYLEIIAI